MGYAIYQNMIINVGLIVLVAYLTMRLRFAQEFIVNDHQTISDKIFMAVIFGLIGIASTYSGIDVNGAIANTRVIGVVVGGIIGGPIVGLGAGLIAGVHRWAIDIGGFTALACCVATISEGLIGGFYSRIIRQRNNDFKLIFLVAMVAEIAQMAIILMIARPFAEAWKLVEIIALPMILINSLGVTILLSIVNSVVIEQNHQAAKRIRNVIAIADECLPYLRQGLYDRFHVQAALNVILRQSDASGVLISDHKEVLCFGGPGLKKFSTESKLPAIAHAIMHSSSDQCMDSSNYNDSFHEALKQFTAVGSPLTHNGQVIGSLILLMGKSKWTQEIDVNFVSGLAKLFSTQLELAQVEIQTKLRQKAEFQALQSQINPHFLFNALSTITSFIREKPDEARELLIVLSNYFRKTLQDTSAMISLQDEMNHVQQYLTLEKARFEEKLQIEMDVPADLDCILPSFTLQPIVENAVKHGAMSGSKKGLVSISAWQDEKNTFISVRDNGKGMPKDVIHKLNHGLANGSSVGLTNVQKRLTPLYGENYRLLIWSTDLGTEITVRIPRQSKEEFA